MKLEKVTQLFLIAVCVVSLTVLVKHGLLSNGTDAAVLGMSKYADTLVGQRETSIPFAAWQASPSNLVLLLSSQCHFCAVFIVNSHGVIQKAFLGKLNNGSETQLLHLAAGTTSVGIYGKQ